MISLVFHGITNTGNSQSFVDIRLQHADYQKNNATGYSKAMVYVVNCQRRDFAEFNFVTGQRSFPTL